MRPRTVLLAVLALVAGALLPTGSARAIGGGDTGSSPTSAGLAQTVHLCTLYANHLGFGAWCGSGSGGVARTWQERLGGNPFVPCKDDPVPDGVLTPPDPPGGGGWYVRTCIRDANLNSTNGGNAHPVSSLVWVPAGQTVYQPVPDWMTWLWNRVQGRYPAVFLTTAPTAIPRVNVPTVFTVGTNQTTVDGTDVATHQRQFWDGNQQITMQAFLRHLTVYPGIDPNEAGIDCGAGTTPYDPALGPFDQPSTCKVTYLRSSADQPGAEYSVRSVATWEAGWFDAGAVWHSLGSFDVTSTQLIPVQEVQAIQVLGSPWLA